MFEEPREKICRFCGTPWLVETILNERPQKCYATNVALNRFYRLGCAAFGRYGLPMGSHVPEDGKPDDA